MVTSCLASELLNNNSYRFSINRCVLGRSRLRIPLCTAQSAGKPRSSPSRASAQALCWRVPVIFATGNMALRKTGNWRTYRPVIHLDDCNGCAICYARCPEGDIRMDADDKPVIDYDHCKGCLIGQPSVPSTPLKLSGRWPWHGTDTENLLVSEHRLNYSSKGKIY